MSGERKLQRPVRVVIRRAGDLLLTEREESDGGEGRPLPPVAPLGPLASDIVECASVVTFEDGTERPMRLRLPRRWVQDAGLTREPSAPESAVRVRRRGRVSALRLSDVAAHVGVTTPVRIPEWLEQARRLIDESVRTATAMSRIAAEVGVHPVHLSRSFRAQFGITPSAYLAKRRLEHACETLMDGTQPMSRVAHESGFADQAHMTRRVCAAIALTPGQLRERCIGNGNGRTPPDTI